MLYVDLEISICIYKHKHKLGQLRHLEYVCNQMRKCKGSMSFEIQNIYQR